jgi:predicted RNA-binding protein associated with RNAse of E/G family
VHPPKRETFDVPSGTNTDPKGFVRSVSEYRVEPFGLYMSRAVPGHPKLEWLESWLLPDLGIRVTDWWFASGHERDQDFYMDIVDVERDGEVWRTLDHYLDIVVRTGRGSEVIDLDEYVEAVATGVLDPAAAERALNSSYRAVAGLAAHGHDVVAWLGSLDMPVHWRRH